ncbi:hypothetical protein Cgig2_020646 [Carnegiea gigantea]|uniref:Uncharacterized protein n=1 Tax=Carnegiea gigantea TaxID=171969 RepID=A0A9Q1JYJ5_9CARY|nr:hypothetical protein Cgig2_020646 [Carnegiea gigantea]
MEIKGHLMLKKAPPLASRFKPRNASKYYEFCEQNSHTIAESQELKKALHEHTNRGQIDHFLKHGARAFGIGKEKTHESSQEECSTEIVASIAGVGIIRLSLWFGDKIKSRNLEVDFLVVDMPIAYNVISGSLTLHRVQAVIAPYLLHIQYESNDGIVRKLFGG